MEKLQNIQGSLTPVLMTLTRLGTLLARQPELQEQLSEEDLETLAVLQEHFYALILIREHYRPDRELDDSELNHARKIMGE
ncbi:hypothetical protein GCM10008106_26980 [Mongoliitalea lutea]|uniref:Uncharacterized protein n=1 Tax=Mongoliitalea lutea TaxID=849756 RepID=A0A8J3D138_9BACT|nr:hypothetical protein GCM10008106_26980 [Mongoliitalea lutea]